MLWEYYVKMMDQKTFLNCKTQCTSTLSCNLDWINFLLPSYLLWIHSYLAHLTQVAESEVYPSLLYWFFLFRGQIQGFRLPECLLWLHWSMMGFLSSESHPNFNLFFISYCGMRLCSSKTRLPSLLLVFSRYCQLQVLQGSLF